MKVKTKREEELTDCNYLSVKIRDTYYRVSESVDGKLCINKTSHYDDGPIAVYPRYANEIEIN